VDGNLERNVRPRPVTADKVLEWGYQYQQFIAKTGGHPARLDPKYKHRVK
jgi:hypothetical protein